MNKNLLHIATAAALSAALFAALPLGQAAYGFLFFFAYIPVFFVGIRIHHLAALFCALLAAFATGLFGNGYLGVVYFTLVGFPCSLVCFYGLKDGSMTRKHMGYSLLSSGFASALAVMFAVLQLGDTPQDIQATLSKALSSFFDQGASQNNATFKGLSAEEKTMFIDGFASFLPSFSSFFIVLIVMSNFDLTSRLLKFFKVSQPLREPFFMVQLPKATFALFCICCLGLFLDGYFEIVASVFLGAFVACYALVGLAIVHALTLGVSFRPFLLMALYFSVFVFQGAVLILAALSLADLFLEFRKKLKLSTFQT